MKSIRRVLISIFRRKKESILYLLITTVLMSLLCSSLLCYRASSSSVKKIKEELGSTIKIKGSFSSLRYNYYNLALPEGYSYQDIENEAESVISALQEYENDERVTYADYSRIKLLVRDTKMEPKYSSNDNLPTSDFDELHDNFEELNAMIKKPGSFTDLMILYYYQWAVLYGVNTEYNDFFQSTGKFTYYKITKGRFFTPEEIQEGKHVCIVQRNSGYYDSDNVLHKYELGDTVSVLNVTVNNNEEIVQTDVYTFEIVGFFSKNTSGNAWSYLFVPNKVVEDIQKTDEQLSRENNCYVLSDEWKSLKHQTLTDDLSILLGIHAEKKVWFLQTPVIKVKDVKYAEEIVNELKEKLPYKDIIVTVDATEYETVTGSVGMLESTSKMYMILCVFVSIAVLSLITVISVSRRRHEMGIYLALGEKRRSIIFRIVAEYLIIGALCIGIALVAGNRIAGKVGNDVIREYEKAHKEKLERRDPQTLNIIESFDITLKKEDILSVIAIGSGIIVITSLASALIILTLNPKKILMVE